jgi:hypothetical protein
MAAAEHKERSRKSGGSKSDSREAMAGNGWKRMPFLSPGRHIFGVGGLQPNTRKGYENQGFNDSLHQFFGGFLAVSNVLA